jgi:hypothetical protein
MRGRNSLAKNFKWIAGKQPGHDEKGRGHCYPQLLRPRLSYSKRKRPLVAQAGIYDAINLKSVAIEPKLILLDLRQGDSASRSRRYRPRTLTANLIL